MLQSTTRHMHASHESTTQLHSVHFTVRTFLFWLPSAMMESACSTEVSASSVMPSTKKPLRGSSRSFKLVRLGSSRSFMICRAGIKL